jgi:GTPase SAR1 family protein
MKIWDIGGQFQYRQNWIDYAKNGDVIIFMVDSSNVSTHSFLFIMYIVRNNSSSKERTTELT